MLQQLEEEAAAEKERGQALKQRQELRSQALISVGSCRHAKMEKVNHANANRPEMARMQESAAAGKK